MKGLGWVETDDDCSGLALMYCLFRSDFLAELVVQERLKVSDTACTW